MSPDFGSQARPLFPEAVTPSTFSKVTCTGSSRGWEGIEVMKGAGKGGNKQMEINERLDKC